MVRYSISDCGGRYVISVSGHTNLAPRGSDIVCSAVSTLARVLVAAFDSLDSRGDLSEYYRSLTEGALEIDATVKERAAERVDAVTECVTEVFEMLEESFPGAVIVE